MVAIQQVGGLGGPDEWRGGKLKLRGGVEPRPPGLFRAELGVPSHPGQAFLSDWPKVDTNLLFILSMDQTTGVVRGARGAAQTAREGGRRDSSDAGCGEDPRSPGHREVPL